MTQNNAFQGQNWSQNDNIIFGFCRPPKPPMPPQTPPQVRGGQKWPKCTCTSPILIITDKKVTFAWVNILTYFFTRNAPHVESVQFTWIQSSGSPHADFPWPFANLNILNILNQNCAESKLLSWEGIRKISLCQVC